MARIPASTHAAAPAIEPAAWSGAWCDWVSQLQRLQIDRLFGWQRTFAEQCWVAGDCVAMQMELLRLAQSHAIDMVDAWWSALRPPQANPAAPTDARVDPVEQARSMWDGLVAQWTGGVPID